METNERKYINNIETKLQQTAELHEQLGKEKKLRQETQAVFEEQDLKLCQLTDNHLKAIDEQKRTILILQKKITDYDAINKTYQSSHTQSTPLVNDNSNYFVSLAQLLISCRN